MAPNYNSFLFVILSIFAVLTPNEASEGGAVVGGWRPIENLQDPEVVKIAQYAVEEHNKEAKTSLSFVSLIKGETQIVSGTKYRLVVAAIDDGTAAADTKNYAAVVWSKPWQNFKQLLSFVEVPRL